MSPMVIHRPTLYVAAPYTNPDPVVNTHFVCRVATIIFEETSWVPVVPHLSLLWHAVTPRPIEFWYDLDIQQMLHCNAMCRLPGASTGADREVDVALAEVMRIVSYAALPPAARECWESRP